MKKQRDDICKNDAVLARELQNKEEEEALLQDVNSGDKLLTTTNDEQLAIAVQQNEYEIEEDAKLASRLYQRQVEECNRKDARKQLGIPSKEDKEEKWIEAEWEDPKVIKKLQKHKKYREAAEAAPSTTGSVWDKIEFEKPKKRKANECVFKDYAETLDDIPHHTGIITKRRKVMRHPKNPFKVVDNEGVARKGPIPTQVSKERIKKKLMQQRAEKDKNDEEKYMMKVPKTNDEKTLQVKKPVLGRKKLSKTKGNLDNQKLITKFISPVGKSTKEPKERIITQVKESKVSSDDNGLEVDINDEQESGSNFIDNDNIDLDSIVAQATIQVSKKQDKLAVGKSIETGKPTESAKPAESSEVDDHAKSSESNKDTESTLPILPIQPAQTTVPTQPDQTIVPSQPIEPTQHSSYDPNIEFEDRKTFVDITGHADVDMTRNVIQLTKEFYEHNVDISSARNQREIDAIMTCHRYRIVSKHILIEDFEKFAGTTTQTKGYGYQVSAININRKFSTNKRHGRSFHIVQKSMQGMSFALSEHH